MFLYFNPYMYSPQSLITYPTVTIRNFTYGVIMYANGMCVSSDTVYQIGYKSANTLNVFDVNGNAGAAYTNNTQGAVIIKYNKSTDNPVFIARIESTGSDTNYGGHVDGNFVYVHGLVGAAAATITDFTNASPLTAIPASRVYFLKFNNTTGAALWRATFDGASNGLQTRSASYNDTFAYYAANRNTAGNISIYNASNDTTPAATSVTVGTTGRLGVLVQYNATTGAVNWYASTICDGSNLSYSHRGLQTTSTGEVLVFGDNISSTSITYYWSNDTASNTVSRQSASYIMKYTTSGSIATVNGNDWTIWLDAPSGTTRTYLYSLICTPQDDSIYGMGYNEGAGTDFVNVGGTVALSLTNACNFVAKWNALGTCQWCSIATGSINLTPSTRVVTDSLGNVYAYHAKGTGTMSLTDATRTNVVLTVPSTTANTPVIVKYDATGTPLWYIYNTGTSTNAVITSMTIDGTNLYISGYRTGSIIWTCSAGGGVNVGTVNNITVVSSFYMRFFLDLLP